MTDVVIISDRTRRVDATLDDGRVLLEGAALPDAIGWELRDEGLCRGDTCVPVRDPSRLFVGRRVDLGAVAAALGREAVVDAGAGIAAVALAAEGRRQALDTLHAPPFTLPGLDGVEHGLDEWLGVKKLLLAFASW